MTYPIQRTALILLAGTALTACASPRYPTQARLLDLPPPAVAPPAQAAPQQLAQADAPLAPHASVPVESAPLAPPAPAPTPAPRAPETAAPALAAAESAPALAMAPTGEDAAARVRHRHHHAAAAPVEDAEPATYKVRKGDTLEKVAPKLGVDIETLAKLNGLKKPYRLHPGQVLHGPQPEGHASAKGKAAGRAHAESYVVKKGDTLFSIAKAHGISVEQLKAANHLGRSNSISHGQTLRLAGDAEPADETPAPRGRHRGEAPAEEPASHGAMGRVVEVEGAGRSYRVRRGDTAEKAARKLGVSVEELGRLNHLKRPYHVRAGQTLHGAGGSTSKAYVVARGDTLAAIAQRFGVSEGELRAANGLKRHAAVKPGRRLRLPGGSRDRGREEYQPPRYTPPAGGPLPPMRPSTPLPSQPQPYSPGGGGGGSGITGAPSASAPIPDAEISQRGRGLFAWPIKGAIIAGFGDRGGGQRNDGLDIRANAGDPVRAAAAGNVVYAGDQVPGFGNLVLIQHADGWVTAYGHLGRVDVRMQQKVSQGQQIGEAGTSGGVSEPQLHFEVRYKPSPDDRARPVDPALVLPK
ncbi:MAG: LysM peptidoglycan-binding domain-containing protein [Caulobacterales bacterium]|nr:LysM peptidoglycan-binding domain-containing protein [Caulobacterales bacterium]